MSRTESPVAPASHGGRGTAARSPETLLRVYEDLVLLRTLDEHCDAFQKQGRLWTYPPMRGLEAVQAGIVHAVGSSDWIVPTYREPALRVLRGAALGDMLAWYRGHPTGWVDPRPFRVAPLCVPVASQVPHATGLAWGLRLRGDDGAVVALFGDGATSEGAFHEGTNLGAVMGVPLVLVCNNNGWAISTPTSRQTLTPTMAEKAAAYGISAERVDGADVLAVLTAVEDALAAVRSGAGPHMIEVVTRRAVPHGAMDDPAAYMNPTELEEAGRVDCVARFEDLLRRRGLLDDGTAADCRHRAASRINEAMTAAEAREASGREAIFDNVYAQPLPALERQRLRALDGW